MREELRERGERKERKKKEKSNPFFYLLNNARPLAGLFAKNNHARLATIIFPAVDRRRSLLYLAAACGFEKLSLTFFLFHLKLSSPFQKKLSPFFFFPTSNSPLKKIYLNSIGGR